VTDQNYDAMLAAIQAKDAIVRTEVERKQGPRKTQLKKSLALPIPSYAPPPIAPPPVITFPPDAPPGGEPIPSGALVLPAGVLVYDRTWFERGAVVVGAGIGKTIVLRKPGLGQSLLQGQYALIRDLTVDGNSANVPNAGNTEIELQADQTLRRVEVKNFRALGINAGGGVLEDFVIAGVAPVGTSSDLSYMGIHTGEDCKGFLARRGTISGCAANGVFLDGDGEVLEDLELTENHRSVFPYGGGQVDLSGKSRNASIWRVNCGGSSGPKASGFELNGVNHRVEDCKSWGHKLWGFIGQEKGPLRLVRCEAWNNGANFYANAGVTVIQQDCNWHE
jgi:hypothetical protein